jgi:hypothetical protein
MFTALCPSQPRCSKVGLTREAAEADVPAMQAASRGQERPRLAARTHSAERALLAPLMPSCQPPREDSVASSAAADRHRHARASRRPYSSRGGGGMPLEDELFMSPWDKWTTYRHPPLKMVAHVLLILVATPTVLFAEREKVSFLHDLRVELVNLYYPPRCRPECLAHGVDGGRYCELPPPCTFMALDDVTAFVSGVVEGYYGSKDKLVARIDYIPRIDRSQKRHAAEEPPSELATVEPVRMRVHYQRPSAPGDPLSGTVHYELHRGQDGGARGQDGGLGGAQDGGHDGRGGDPTLGPLGGLPTYNLTQRAVFDQITGVQLVLHFKSTE